MSRAVNYNFDKGRWLRISWPYK